MARLVAVFAYRWVWAFLDRVTYLKAFRTLFFVVWQKYFASEATQVNELRKLEGNVLSNMQYPVPIFDSLRYLLIFMVSSFDSSNDAAAIFANSLNNLFVT